jgi:hypothetical protein
MIRTLEALTLEHGVAWHRADVVTSSPETRARRQLDQWTRIISSDARAGRETQQKRAAARRACKSKVGPPLGGGRVAACTPVALNRATLRPLQPDSSIPAMIAWKTPDLVPCRSGVWTLGRLMRRPVRHFSPRDDACWMVGWRWKMGRGTGNLGPGQLGGVRRSKQAGEKFAASRRWLGARAFRSVRR